MFVNINNITQLYIVFRCNVYAKVGGIANITFGLFGILYTLKIYDDISLYLKLVAMNGMEFKALDIFNWNNNIFD